MSYAVNLRIPVRNYIPEDIRECAGRAFVNVSAYSYTKPLIGSVVLLAENCRDAEVYSVTGTSRDPSSFKFVI